MARSASTTLRYYRSVESTIATADTEVGTDSVSRLEALASGDESISLTAPYRGPGTYYYGACVDAVSDESDATNNCSDAVAVTVGAAPAPDLVVDAPTVSTSAPTAGASFTLSATVRNQGNGASSSTTLRYYQSADSTITTGDTAVGTDSVSSLDASSSGDESTGLTAPSTPGTYYYGACVNAVSDESDTQNNCSDAVAVTVGAAPAPDLVVDAPTVSTSAPTAGASFTLSVTVRNQGNGRLDSTSLSYYRSTDATITIADTEVGTDSVFRLDASGSGDELISLTAPSEQGTYYYGACVDPVSDESDTANNCSSAVAVTVGAAPAPDLVVDTPTVSESAPTAGASFTLSATVRNQGNARSGFTTLRYYRSTDSTITTGDNAVGTDSVSPLNASESGDESISLDAPSTPGTYFYGACVDSVSDESDTTNNCSSAVSVTVAEAPAPDLVVDTPTVSNYAPAAGASFTMDATVRNLGTGASGSTTLRYYQSADSTVTAADTEVGTDSVSRLNASASGDESISLTAPDTAGTYYYGACVDSVSNESNNTNNCSGAVTVTVGAGAQQTSTCATGAAVSDAANNPGLVADCDALLAAKEQLEGTVPLNWSADTPIFDWDGIISLYGRGRITWIALEKDLDGTIPAELGDLTELTTLSLSNNQLTGAIPPELGDLSKLTKLNLSNNRLSGAIPSNLGRLNSLKSLSLSQNELSGAIPAELAGLSELQTLRLRENQLTESIPSALGRLAKLSSLVLSNNQLTGTIPSELGNLSLLYSLSASDNQLTGSLPSSLGRLSKLNRLDFANNRLTGSFPPELGNLGNLELLYLYANKLSGDVPSELGDLTKLDGLFLYGNQLTGCVPEHLEAQLDRSTLWAVGVTFCDDSTTPGAPTGLTATADGQTEIDLSWRAPSDDGGANITGYRIEVSTDGSNWSDLEANTRSTNTSYSHTGLTAGSTRHYRVSAINSEGTGPVSNVDDATTEPAPVVTEPGAPTGLTATADGQTEIDLSWTRAIGRRRRRHHRLPD